MSDHHTHQINQNSDKVVSQTASTALILRSIVLSEGMHHCGLEPGISENAFRALFSGLKRRMGETALLFADEQVEQLTTAGFPSAAVRPVHILGRVLLLLELSLQQREEDMPAFVHKLFIRGDNMEQCAILCALPLLPAPSSYVDTAVQATRGYVLEVFDTLINSNPYPALYFNDNTFNQSVLKALFLGVPLQDVIGLKQRINPELKRMVNAFASERRIAGREVPADVNLII